MEHPQTNFLAAQFNIRNVVFVNSGLFGKVDLPPAALHTQLPYPFSKRNTNIPCHPYYGGDILGCQSTLSYGGSMKSLYRFFAFAVLAAASASWAQQMTVKIIDRRTSETNYSYQIPGRSTSTTYGGANCNGNAFGNSASTNCYGSSATNTRTTSPQDVSFSVTGATFSLLLPDGRIAVVNCVSKFAERMAGPRGNHRSCRMPIVDEIQAEFKGKNAKLQWTVSLDGKKKESETYSVLGILPPAPNAK